MENKKKYQEDIQVGIVGAGYVGLPLAIAFSKIFSVKVYDFNKEKVLDLNNGIDKTDELSVDELYQLKKIEFFDEIHQLASCNFFIICVPTPIDQAFNPDLKPLKNATKAVGKIIKLNDIIVFESTVFPGCTEEVCVPILENFSRMKLNQGFYCGYSPERINPGDNKKKLYDITKVTSGSTTKIAKKIDSIYQLIIKAGTYSAPSIKVAEAAKVIENTQRDLNIALINEISIICNNLNINTSEVLAAARTKWNFLDFKPGLVGGHCIGVDPYYLTYRARQGGYSPSLITAGRKINDEMHKYVASEFIKLMTRKSININNSNVIIIGFTFKENCKDIRNTKVADLSQELQQYGCNITIYDPLVDPVEAFEEYGMHVIAEIPDQVFDGLILAVDHKQFKALDFSIFEKLLLPVSVVCDLKSFFNSKFVDLSL